MSENERIKNLYQTLVGPQKQRRQGMRDLDQARVRVEMVPVVPDDELTGEDYDVYYDAEEVVETTPAIEPAPPRVRLTSPVVTNIRKIPRKKQPTKKQLIKYLTRYK